MKRFALVALMLVVGVSALLALLRKPPAPERRGELGKGPPEGTIALAAHMGLARVGQLVLTTEAKERSGEKLYHLDDKLSIDATGFGSVTMTLQATVEADLSVRELVFYVSAPDATGATARHQVRIVRDGDDFTVTEARNEDRPTKRRLEGVPKGTLLLTPPLGVGTRALQLAKGEGRLSFPALDVATCGSATLTLSFEEEGEIDVRGTRVRARHVARDEGSTRLETWLASGTGELLRVELGEGGSRLSFVGRESTENSEDLPEPSLDERAKEGPAATVLRFFRASGRGDRKAIAALLDVDAIFASTNPTDPKLRATFEKVLLDTLTGEGWRRSDSVKLVAEAARPEDLAEEVTGERAKVRAAGAPDAPFFALEKEEGVWKIVALPIRSP
jgi:ketosteroid isomerase-like protein